MLAIIICVIISIIFLLAIARKCWPVSPSQTLLDSLPIWSYLKHKLQCTLRGKDAADDFEPTDDANHPRLSRCSSQIKPEYDVVVIGSGYGGGVAASRMSRAGKSVCVLERGLERWPGEYPHKFTEAMKEYRVSGQVLGTDFEVGKKSSLYQTIKGDGQDVFLGCGLGGTSLINAGVFLQADQEILKSKDWPEEIRGSFDALDQCKPYRISGVGRIKGSSADLFKITLEQRACFNQHRIPTATRLR